MKNTLASLVVSAALAGAASGQPAATTSANAPAPMPAPAGASAAPQLSPAAARLALCQVDATIARLSGEAPPESARSAACASDFSMSNAAKYIQTAGVEIDIAALGQTSVDYYAFGALQMKSPVECAALGPLLRVVETTVKRTLTKDSDWEANCRQHYLMMRMAAAFIARTPDAYPACMLFTDDPDIEPGLSREEMCRKAAAASLAGAETVLCGGEPKKPRPGGGPTCHDTFRAMRGDSSPCARFKVDHKPLCLGFAAYAKAAPAKDPKACGSSAVCLAMMGQTVAMSLRAERTAAALLSPGLIADAREKLAQVDLSGDPLDLNAAREIDEREERMAELLYKNQPSSRAPSGALDEKLPVQGKAKGRTGGQGDGQR